MPTRQNGMLAKKKGVGRDRADYNAPVAPNANMTRWAPVAAGTDAKRWSDAAGPRADKLPSGPRVPSPGQRLRDLPPVETAQGPEAMD